MVPDLLLGAVAQHRSGVSLAILLKVAAVRRAPFLSAVAADLPIFRVGGQPPPAVFPATALLTGTIPTNGLPGMKSGRAEGLLAVSAASRAHPSSKRQPVLLESPVEFLPPPR